MRKLCAAFVLMLALTANPAGAQDNDPAPAKAEKSASSPVLSYVIFSISTLAILVIICAPSRRPVPTEE